jgi:hypothetical protein
MKVFDPVTYSTTTRRLEVGKPSTNTIAVKSHQTIVQVTDILYNKCSINITIYKGFA